ncbi:MAG: flagellar hook-basal body protein [Phycisphaerales bacterium]
MNYGLHVAASGLLVNMHRQDVIANNLANVNTTGFKPDIPMVQQRAVERLEDGLPIAPHEHLERLGGGVLAAPTKTRFSDGPVEITGRALDVAIRGEGFLQLSSGSGDGSEKFRYSRDGRLTLSDSGQLVHAGSGMRVLDENNRPIRLRPGADITIEESGLILQDGSPVARIRLVTAPSPDLFVKAGSNMFMLPNNAQESVTDASGTLQQHALEGSAVNPILSLMAIQNASAAANSNARMLQYHDELLGSAISRFGRVS